MSNSGENLNMEVLLHLKRAQEVLKSNQRKEAIENTIQHELNMQVVAAKSPLKWKTVKCLEGGISLPSCVTLDSQDVRKAEKESMSFDRDLRTAFNASKRKREEDGLYGKGRGSWSTRGSSSYRGRGRGRGGSVGGGERACFRCGNTQHLIAECPKSKESGGGN